MKIEQYISQLLYRYQCVTVPGFGAFLTEIKSAQMHENTNSFYPPKKQISFNPNLKNNDGLLANHIALTGKTTYETAVNLIAIEVENWNKILNENNGFTVKNIGSFSLSFDKNLSFTPFENINYLSSSFGLNAFVSPVVKREIFEQKLEILEQNQLITLIPERNNNYSLLKYAAVFLVTTGIGTFGGMKFYENKMAQETLLVETNVQKQVEDKIQEATFFISNPLPAVTLTLKEKSLNYHVVAGAFRKERNAQKAFEYLNKKGYKARRIPANKNGLFPVLYGSFATYGEAKSIMNKIQKSQNPDTWILIEEF